jgi:dienelactone hydrolase
LLFTTHFALADEELAADLNEEIVRIPLLLDGDLEATLTATVFRPMGAGPFPLVVLSHGSPVSWHDRPAIGRYRRLPQIAEFVRRGFAVIVPIRRGFGATGGVFAEDYKSCREPDYISAGTQAGRDLLATMAYARKLVFVDPERILLVGQSAGGFASLAASSMDAAGVIGVVNFAGGRGGDPANRPGEPCGPERMTAAIARFAQTIKVPVLWHYAENDRFFGPTYVRAWFEAFERAGGKGRLVMQPPFGRDGHGLFASDLGLPIWTLEFDRFLAEIGLSAGDNKGTAQRAVP